MNKGRLIVFEGTDGSGKATQSRLLFERLEREGVDCRKLNFPRYGEKSAALVELYLGGAFGSHPDDVNAYAASTFYAVDRYASYKQDWGGYYEAGGLLIADRSYGNIPDSGRIIGMRILDFAILIILTAASWRNQHRISSFQASLINKLFDIIGERIVSSFTRSFLFLVIMTEFYQQVVAFFHLGQ